MHFILTHMNRTNELRKINDLVIGTIPLMNKDVELVLFKSNKTLLNLISIFNQWEFTLATLEKVTDRISQYVTTEEAKLAKYMEAINEMEPIVDAEAPTVRQRYLLESIYHFVATPVCLHKHFVDLLTKTWSVIYNEKESVLVQKKTHYGNSFYISHIEIADKLFAKYESTDVELMTRDFNKQTLDSLELWLQDTNFDKDHAINSNNFVSYGNSIKSYIETNAPNMDTELVILKHELTKSNRKLRSPNESG